MPYTNNLVKMFVITQPRILSPCDLGLENKDPEKNLQYYVTNILSHFYRGSYQSFLF